MSSKLKVRKSAVYEAEDGTPIKSFTVTSKESKKTRKAKDSQPDFAKKPLWKNFHTDVLLSQEVQEVLDAAGIIAHNPKELFYKGKVFQSALLYSDNETYSVLRLEQIPGAHFLDGYHICPWSSIFERSRVFYLVLRMDRFKKSATPEELSEIAVCMKPNHYYQTSENEKHRCWVDYGETLWVGDHRFGTNLARSLIIEPIDITAE